MEHSFKVSDNDFGSQTQKIDDDSHYQDGASKASVFKTKEIKVLSSKVSIPANRERDHKVMRSPPAGGYAIAHVKLNNCRNARSFTKNKAMPKATRNGNA
ncbi:MAG: hypothetical protein V7K85_12080 [Nostoc sp.]